MEKVKIISGSANIPLAEKVAKKLGKDLTKTEIKRFKDGEIYIRILENVRGCHVFVIQPIAPHPNDTNNNLVELAIIIDALKRSSAAKIEVVVPYYGYARQDRKAKSREPITAKLIANLLTSAGASRVITIDLHSAQIQGFFDIPLDNLTALPLFLEHIKKMNLKNYVVLAPDVGSSKKTHKIAEALEVPLVIIEKRRPKHNQATVANLIGDVKDKNIIIIDDMIDTAGTIAAAANILPEYGAKDIYIFSTHGLFSGDAKEKLMKCPAKSVITTDTINIPEDKKFDKLEVLSSANILAEAIKRIYKGESVSKLFKLTQVE